ncbi:VOC family protein [Reichenbachiella ulvae]|uniref:VOC family protein n=1 Tax=Reichenbachiella ulvae TaxID=2980104 RepID=A0ABT3CWQ9_9BACT|nr:VOC family protein [Reichenbachiella ulvae]MCV9388128.1 VOC family protein [Reichenbachiella ulvae]
MNLNQVTLPSIDPENSVRFYQLLGLRLIVDALPRYARMECPDGASTLSIHLVEKLPQGELPTLYFETERLDEEYQRLKEAKVNFDLAPTDQSWLWREARLKDPDGNPLILFFAGKNRKNPPWRVA